MNRREVFDVEPRSGGEARSGVIAAQGRILRDIR
jgi:hypothetical protein